MQMFVLVVVVVVVIEIKLVIVVVVVKDFLTRGLKNPDFIYLKIDDTRC